MQTRPDPMHTDRIRARLTLGACGVVVISSAAAFFAGDPKAAAIIATQALLAICLAFAATRRERHV
jgi:hypothetical protein